MHMHVDTMYICCNKNSQETVNTIQQHCPHYQFLLHFLSHVNYTMTKVNTWYGFSHYTVCFSHSPLHRRPTFSLSVRGQPVIARNVFSLHLIFQLYIVSCSRSSNVSSLTTHQSTLSQTTRNTSAFCVSLTASISLFQLAKLSTTSWAARTGD